MAERFFLGAVVATPNALKQLARAGVDPRELIHRHQGGDWGDLCPEDRHLNDLAVSDGSRVFSSHRIGRSDEKVWVITDAADEFCESRQSCARRTTR